MWVLALYSGYMYPTNLCSLPVSSPSIQWIYVPYKSLLTSCEFSLYTVDICSLQISATVSAHLLQVLTLPGGYVYSTAYTVDMCTLQHIQWICVLYSIYGGYVYSIYGGYVYSAAYTVDMCTLQHIRWICVLCSIYGGYLYSTAYTVDMCTLQHIRWICVLCSIYGGYLYSTAYTVDICTLQHIRWICVLCSIYGGYVYSTAYTVDMCTLQHIRWIFVLYSSLCSTSCKFSLYTVDTRPLHHIQWVCALYNSLCSPPASSRSVWWPVAAPAQPSPPAPSARGARCPAAGPPSRSPALASCEPGPRSGCASCQSPAQHTTACQSSRGPAVPPPPLQWNPASKSKTTLKSSRSGHKDHPKNQAEVVIKTTLKIKLKLS